MDAVKFLKEYKRMCYTVGSCSDCKIERFCTYEKGSAVMIVEQNEPYESEMIVKEVEEWAKEHPAKTRQDEILKMFPKAVVLSNGPLWICPKSVDMDIKCTANDDCFTCREKYWLQEVE